MHITLIIGFNINLTSSLIASPSKISIIKSCQGCTLIVKHSYACAHGATNHGGAQSKAIVISIYLSFAVSVDGEAVQTAIHVVNQSLYLALHIVDGYRANHSTRTLRRSGNANTSLAGVHTVLILCLHKHIIRLQGAMLNYRPSVAIDGVHYNGSANAHAGGSGASAG